MTIGERLKSQRSRRKLTQQALAREAGVSQGLIARIETGDVKDPAASVVRRLAQALGITVDYLVGMYENIHSDEPSLLVGASLMT
jgi:transcriptional regulator with XRE-family HTH domain